MMKRHFRHPTKEGFTLCGNDPQRIEAFITKHITSVTCRMCLKKLRGNVWIDPRDEKIASIRSYCRELQSSGLVDNSVAADVILNILDN